MIVMRISANLDRLEQHQDYLRQQLRVSNRLLDLLIEHQKMAAESATDDAIDYPLHIQTVQRFYEVTRQRSILLQDTFEHLSMADHILSNRLKEADGQLRR